MKNLFTFFFTAIILFTYCNPKVNKEKEEWEKHQKNVNKAIEENRKIIKESVKNAMNSILISDFYALKDGNGFNIIWQNISDKIVKYIYFTVVPINAVGDQLNGNVSNANDFEVRVRIIGPIKPTEWNGKDKFWSVWTNCSQKSEIANIKIRKIEIEYMDDTSISIEEEYVKYTCKNYKLEQEPFDFKQINYISKKSKNK